MDVFTKDTIDVSDLDEAQVLMQLVNNVTKIGFGLSYERKLCMGHELKS